MIRGVRFIDGLPMPVENMPPPTAFNTEGVPVDDGLYLHADDIADWLEDLAEQRQAFAARADDPMFGQTAHNAETRAKEYEAMAEYVRSGGHLESDHTPPQEDE